MVMQATDFRELQNLSQAGGCSRRDQHRGVVRLGERQGLVERDVDDCMDAGDRATHGAVAENRYLAGEAVEAGPMDQLLGSSITYRIAVGPQQGRKVFTLQTLPVCDEPFDDGVGNDYRSPGAEKSFSASIVCCVVSAMVDVVVEGEIGRKIHRCRTVDLCSCQQIQ